MEQPDVSVVVVTWNARDHIERSLESVRGRDVIVVDNGSTDGSATVAADAGARVLRAPGLNVAELRNRGARLARGGVLAFVDADHEIDRDWIRIAVDTLERADVGATGSLCIAPPDGTWVQRMYDALRGRTDRAGDAEWLGAGNLVVRRAAFDAVGGFDVGLETCEDVELCHRLRGSGLRIIGDGRLRNVHFGDPATLRSLFESELWRGRDNLIVSLRGPLTLRALPSMLVPVIDLLLLLALGVSWLFGLRIGATVSAAALSGLLFLALLRTARMARHLAGWPPVALGQAFAVAFVYDAARALALVAKAGHRRRA